MSKILVIDDNKTTRLLLRRELKLAGYEVTVAADGFEGLRIAKEIYPDLIICDWLMPGLDGVEVCRQVKATPKLSTSFFILLSVRGQVTYRVQGLDAGADEFLSKPIENEDLLARVRAGLRLHQLTQQLSQTNKHLEILVEVQSRLLAKAELVTSLSTETNDFYRKVLEPLAQVTGSSRVIWCSLCRHPQQPELLGWLAADRKTKVETADFYLWSDRWADCLARGEIVAGMAGEFPAEERQLLERSAIRSILILPLIVNGQLCGFIRFDNCLSDQDADSLLAILRAAVAAISLHQERSIAVEALRESEARYRAIVEDQTELICRFAPDGTLTFVNDAYCRYFGARREDLIGVRVVELTPDLQGDAKTPLVVSREMRVTKPNGEVRRMQWTKRAVFNQQGDSSIEFQAVGRDITERKQAEEETIKALAKEKKLNELKTNFVSMVSHEFRGPLTVIGASSGLLAYDLQKLPSQQQEQKLAHIQRIQRSIVKMTDMIDQLLLISRAETGSLEFNPTPLNPIQFCRDLVAQINSTNSNNSSIHFVSEGEATTAFMDAQLLEQILNNLLFNAIKYSPNGSGVWLKLILQDTRAIFQVQDQGIGIPPKDIPHLFESFHRCSNVGKIPGTGLGLTIVKKSVELHNGKIHVVSQVEQPEKQSGTTFTVTLPLTTMLEGGKTH